ncbi:hypothetical protein [Sphingobacterium bambusae]|uniref:Uncharacterized protein n=1 Tax=Sphingobacterium bambusae TaxID=662858 RepID=A0ABW6BJY7_9SPHI|nr:hypothetical protein [Sphingobacterium bambusae]WPL50853.1 hypothetical protein SCB77_10380 [Sphingobacterium bambusae]
MKSIRLFLAMFAWLSCGLLHAQEEVRGNVLDDIQVDVKAVHLDPDNDTLSIDLFLISYHMDQREFKLNTYATQVLDASGKKHLFTSLKMGRILINIKDRQNYLHYLFEENVPVPVTIKYADWKQEKPKKLLLVFEDSTEEGKFITQEVDL